jgi:glycopeptide antibiotics resistance protein
MQKYNRTMKKALKALFAVFLTLYLLLLTYLTFFSKFYGRTIKHRSINIIPMRTISEFLTCGYGTRAVMVNLAGNIVAFMPMGFLLPMVFSKLDKLYKVLIASFLASFIIEMLQYTAGVGASDVDDVILNVVGAAVGWLVHRLFFKRIIFH